MSRWSLVEAPCSLGEPPVRVQVQLVLELQRIVRLEDAARI